MGKLAKATVIAILVFLFFVFMSRIDFIVHSILYNYGLSFSYEWANGYWTIYNAIFTVFALAISVAYWLGAEKTKHAAKISIGLFATINLLAFCGVQDILFFVLWSGGLPSLTVVWWWVPWIHIIGTWNSLIQLAFSGAVTCSIAFAWIIAGFLRRQFNNKL